MSQGGSLGGPPSAFPGSNEQKGVTGPGPTPENPGGVFPKSDPTPAEPTSPSPPPVHQPAHDGKADPPLAQPTKTDAPVPGGAQARGQGEAEKDAGFKPQEGGLFSD